MLAVVDGLGHGPDAAAAAERALLAIEENAAEPLQPLVLLCHQALADTRGVAMAIAAVYGDGATEWLSIGNVEAAIVRPHRVDTVYHFAGVVGHQLPRLRVPTTQLHPGELLVMATDGITTAFLDDVDTAHPPSRIADSTVASYARPVDDALVLVAALG